VNIKEISCKQCIYQGSCIHVRNIDSTHTSAKKLRSMGFDNDCDFTIEHIAPLGDPYIVKLKGYNLAIRSKDLTAFDIEK